jgi:hypothetical protein
MAWIEDRQTGFRKASSETKIRKYKPPDLGNKATAEYTPVCRFAGEFGGKFLLNGCKWV